MVMIARKNSRCDRVLIEPQWYLLIEKRQWGPYSLAELKKDPRFTPDTLVRKKGTKTWTQARFIPELKQLFKDEEPLSTPLFDFKRGEGGAQAAIAMRPDPFPFFILFLVVILVLFYFVLYFFYTV